MVWTILVLNILTIIISLKKRVLPYAILTAFFISLVVGQAFQISSDLKQSSYTFYLLNYITRPGFRDALWFVLGTSILSFLLIAISRGYKPGSQPSPRFVFAPPLRLYVILSTYLILLALILIFVVVGFSTFIASSRPGFQTGTSIFLILLSAGIFPALLKIICKCRLRLGDLTCFLITILATIGFSRTYCIMYVFILLLAVYYHRGIADSPLSFKTIISASAIGILGISLFFVVGSVRDALNYTSGSIEDLLAFAIDNPQVSVLSLQRTYRIGVEGMSGLAGAFTQSIERPATVQYDLGSYWLLRGTLQWLPGFVKDDIKGPLDDIDSLNWHSATIISSGVEGSYTSFGWFGMLFYAVVLYLLAWDLPIIALQHPTSPSLKLALYMFLGLLIFFVHGSFVLWIGTSISYAFALLFAWPWMRKWVKRTHSAQAVTGHGE